MNSRERILAMALVGLLVVGGAGFLYFKVYRSLLGTREASIVRLQGEINDRTLQLAELERDQQRLARWRQLSLPANIGVDRPEYQKFLEGVARGSGFSIPGSYTVLPDNVDANSSPKLPGKKEPIYTALPYTVKLQGGLGSLVNFLTQFYSTGLLHRVTSISILRPSTTGPQQRPGDLEVTLKVEALVLNGAEDRTQLLPGVDRRLLALDMASVLQGGPAALALVPFAAGPTGPLGPHVLAHPPKEYANIAGKNIFTGPSRFLVERDGPAVDVTRFVHLTSITSDERRIDARLYDRWNNNGTQLRAEPGTGAPSAGYRNFRILDDDNQEIVKAKVLRIDPRDVIFQVEEKYYGWHIGQSLQEAMEKTLPEEKVKSLKPPTAAKTE